MTAIARRHEISARRVKRVERNLCVYVIIIRSGYSSGSRTRLLCAIRPALPVCSRETSSCARCRRLLNI